MGKHGETVRRGNPTAPQPNPSPTPSPSVSRMVGAVGVLLLFCSKNRWRFLVDLDTYGWKVSKMLGPFPKLAFISLIPSHNRLEMVGTGGISTGRATTPTSTARCSTTAVSRCSGLSSGGSWRQRHHVSRSHGGGSPPRGKPGSF